MTDKISSEFRGLLNGLCLAFALTACASHIIWTHGGRDNLVLSYVVVFLCAVVATMAGTLAAGQKEWGYRLLNLLYCAIYVALAVFTVWWPPKG